MTSRAFKYFESHRAYLMSHKISASSYTMPAEVSIVFKRTHGIFLNQSVEVKSIW